MGLDNSHLLETMRITLTIEADVLKLVQLLSKFSETHKTSYTVKRQDSEFLVEIETDDFGEFVRRLNHLKECTFKVEKVQGGKLLNRLNVSPLKTNVDALVGKTTEARTSIEPIDGGVITLVGEDWFARPVADKTIKTGTKVKVVGVKGVSLIVEEVK